MYLKINYGNTMNSNFRIYLLPFVLFIGIMNISAQNSSENFNFDLPNLLKTTDGKTIQTVEEWEKVRRPEILNLFETYVYGKIPIENIDIKFKVIKSDYNTLDGKAIRKEVIVSMSNKEETLEMNILIFLPKHSRKPTPIFLGMNFYGNQTIHADPNISVTPNYVNNKQEFCITNNRASHLSRGVRANRWPIERILERGYGIASIYYGDIDPDFHDGFKNGIHNIFKSSNSEQREPDAWGAISAWAFGLSKAMDYFETDEEIDHKRVAVLGHSRLGKTALWAGAIDERFAITISNNSGCGGAALSRRKMGETLFDINTRFPHWFCENFHQYNDNEVNLPTDQHMLLGLIAPRPVYVGSAVNDKWADPLGEYLSLFYSGDVYNLYTEEILIEKNLPELNQPRIKGEMGYHIRSGSHDLTKYDWERYMDFADKQFLN